MGPYTQLLIRRTDSDRAITVKVLAATAERLGWAAAFSEAWSPSASVPGGGLRRAYGSGNFHPHEGGIHSGVWLAGNPYRSRSFPRLRFRVTGPWTKADLEALRLATVPQVHAITAGRLRWCRLMA